MSAWRDSIPPGAWPRLLRAEQAAAYSGVSRSTFLRWVDEGLVPGGTLLGKGVVAWDRPVLDRCIDRMMGGAMEDDLDERERRWRENKDRKKAARGRQHQALQV